MSKEDFHEGVSERVLRGRGRNNVSFTRFCGKMSSPLDSVSPDFTRRIPVCLLPFRLKTSVSRTDRVDSRKGGMTSPVKRLEEREEWVGEIG